MLNLECKDNSKMFVSDIEQEMNRSFKANEIFEIIKDNIDNVEQNNVELLENL